MNLSQRSRRRSFTKSTRKRPGSSIPPGSRGFRAGKGSARTRWRSSRWWRSLTRRRLRSRS